MLAMRKIKKPHGTPLRQHLPPGEVYGHIREQKRGAVNAVEYIKARMEGAHADYWRMAFEACPAEAKRRAFEVFCATLPGVPIGCCLIIWLGADGVDALLSVTESD